MPITILTAPLAPSATREIWLGRSSKDARSVKEKRKRAPSTFSRQAYGEGVGWGTWRKVQTGTGLLRKRHWGSRIGQTLLVPGLQCEPPRVRVREQLLCWGGGNCSPGGCGRTS